MPVSGTGLQKLPGVLEGGHYELKSHPEEEWEAQTVEPCCFPCWQATARLPLHCQLTARREVMPGSQACKAAGPWWPSSRSPTYPLHQLHAQTQLQTWPLPGALAHQQFGSYGAPVWSAWAQAGRAGVRGLCFALQRGGGDSTDARDADERRRSWCVVSSDVLSVCALPTAGSVTRRPGGRHREI